MGGSYDDRVLVVSAARDISTYYTYVCDDNQAIRPAIADQPSSLLSMPLLLMVLLLSLVALVVGDVVTTAVLLSLCT